MKKLISIFTLLICMVAISAFAQKRAFTIADLYKIKGVESLSISPDGNRIAFAERSYDLPKGKTFTNVYVMNTEGTNKVAITTNGKANEPFWSSDNKNLYFVSSESGTPQVYRYSFADAKTEKLTDFSMGIGGPVLSPDNQLIAFTADVYPECGADSRANAIADSLATNGPTQAYLADHLLFRHWTSYSEGKCSHIIIYNIAKQTYTDLTPGNFVSPIFMLGGGIGFNFSPDSKELCFVSNHTDHPEANTNADMFLIPVTGGQAVNITKENTAWDGSPIYSPDGKYIAYRKQLVPGHESDRFRLALYNRQTGTSEIITDAFDNWVTDFKWSADSKSIYFAGDVTGNQPIYKIDIASKKITPVSGDKATFAFDLDNKGNIYYTASSTGKPVALYRQNLAKGKTTQITFLNEELENAVDIRPSDTLWVAGADGRKLEVFIVKPHNFDPNKKYPLILNVHGGPQSQWMNSFRGDWQVYPGAGYVVAYPNPHGSTGYGQEYTTSISGDWGGKPFIDLMKVTDALANLSYVDSTRMGAMGWSYGGYMMNWFQAQTKRFKCLASMMGLFDLESMWGTTEEVWFPNFDLKGQPWNSNLYKKWSPSEYVKNFATPTLIITGQLDFRVSYNQSLQYFTTLQTLNIPSRLIILKNDGHWPNTVKSMPLYYDAHLDWFHKYLGGDPAPYDVDKLVKNQVFNTK
ncbi:S9 family peptidase [Paludibacter sp.]|uniref:S9 family peptidase n=1 Tax=Paludibacter sp. TaxID=1898105 RepID=UPI0025CD3E8E|nr:S9 family peptidase [Paludibacter sp.]